MFFYEVLVASPRYHKSAPLTYSSDSSLPIGAIVVAPLQKQKVLAVVVSGVDKPSFVAKPIEKILGPSLPTVSLDLLQWLAGYYPAPFGATVSLFLPQFLLKAPARKAPDAKKIIKPKPLPELTQDQKSALSKIKRSKNTTFLLHGDTATGKTRVYIELAREVLKNSRSVLVLTPEIGLSPQIAAEFEKSFPSSVMIMHSSLTDKERLANWERLARSKLPVVVVGARSALFAPFANLGLVIVDETHEPAYKQEQAPYYHALRTASKLAELHKALLIMGSATPSVVDYFIASSKGIPIIRMQQPAAGKVSLGAPVFVSLRDKNLFSRHPYLSDNLLGSLESTLERGEQALVFLNRRGTARLVICEDCGWQALCPKCDLPLTYHGDNHKMICHTCGYNEPAINACPVCGSTNIIFRSIGTKSVAESLQKLFPKAKVQRFDTDSKKAERLESHYENVHSGKVDILVGTQLLAKGLDLPKLSLVGVVLADTSLYLPDYTSDERTYQLLTQVTGRIARGHRVGQAIIQTYNPGSQAIMSAAGKDWDKFYQKELEERQKFGFPPFVHLLKIKLARKSPEAAELAALKVKEHISTLGLAVQVIGPSPAFHEKSKGMYSWQLVIKSKNRAHLLKIIENLPAGWSYNIDPVNLL